MADQDWKPDPNDVEQRKKELLAEARGETKKGGPSAMAGVGFQFVIMVLVFLFGGQWLDRKLGTGPWLMIAGLMVGGALGFWSLLRVAKAANEADEKGK
jgi:F0F1-type ATP synthase assembly protein I